MLLCCCLYYASTSLVYSAKVIALLKWLNVQSCMTRYKDELYRFYSEPMSRRFITGLFTVLCFCLHTELS